MEIGFLLHLYQPSTQDEEVFKKIYQSCYQPLLKLLKAQKNFKVTLNTPLSLLYQMEKYGYASWLTETKELVDAGKIELIGTAAYHPLLTKIPQKIAEQEIILNECGLANYFGRRSGFEGQAAFMIKDIWGFFPPELAINENLCQLLDSLGYKWTLVEDLAIKEKLSATTIYQHAKSSIKLVARNTGISNLLAFKRDTDITDILRSISICGNKNVVIALDGEFFGHHFKEGIYVLDSIIEEGLKRGWKFKTISELAESEQDLPKTDVQESSWGASVEEFSQGILYPMWEGNEIQALQWQLLDEIAQDYVERDLTIPDDGYETLQIWDSKKVDVLKDETAKRHIQLLISGLKVFESDQMWWASSKVLPTGQVLFYKTMVERGFGIILEYAHATENAELISKVEEKVKLLKTNLNSK